MPHSKTENWANKSQELYEAIVTPTMDDLKSMIQINLINNNEVTANYVNLSTKAYGLDFGKK